MGGVSFHFDLEQSAQPLGDARIKTLSFGDKPLRKPGLPCKDT